MTNPAPLARTSVATQSLAQLVQADGRAAHVFETFGLDYCCGGKKTLGDAAAELGVPLAPILDALEALGAATDADRDPAEWKDLDVLIRHIVDRHHGYVRSIVPSISAWLDRLVERHGARHPELPAVRNTFVELAVHLESHMMKEESILFPFIDELARASREGSRPPLGPFGTILNPVRVMEADHASIGALMKQLSLLTAGFNPPADACATYRSCYGELARFEQDLHRHVYLEDSVLFPSAVELERGA